MSDGKVGWVDTSDRKVGVGRHVSQEDRMGRLV
jgi:hypothetical protein